LGEASASLTPPKENISGDIAMPLTDTYVSLPLELIYVKRDERQRREIETEDLQKSIARIGLINPIVVEEDNDGGFRLVAGERRYMSFKALGYKAIPARFSHQLSAIESAIIELEENIKRKDLPWQDATKAVAKLHGLHVQEDEDWTQVNTAEALSLSEAMISIYLKVNAFVDDPRIVECNSVRQAYEVIDRRESRKRAAAIADLFEEDMGEEDEDEDFDEEDDIPEFEDAPTVSTLGDNIVPISIEGDLAIKPKPKKKGRNIADDIIHGSFLEWAPEYRGRKFNFLHVDFPYGNTDIGPQMLGNEHTMYEDNPELYIQLLNCFCDNLDKFFSDIGWCMFWYSERMGQLTREVFRVKAPRLTVQVHPLIWVHSDNAGISPDPRRRPRHIYDTALLMSRGEMPLIRVKSDAYASPTDHKLHPSTKPVPMLKHFFEMFVDEHTTVFDPTCGSGAALRAAEALGASRVLGIEADWHHCEAARKALLDDRKLENIWEPLTS